MKILIPVSALAEGMKVLTSHGKSDVELGKPFDLGNYDQDKAFETKGGKLVVWRSGGKVLVDVPLSAAVALLAVPL